MALLRKAGQRPKKAHWVSFHAISAHFSRAQFHPLPIYVLTGGRPCATPAGQLTRHAHAGSATTTAAAGSPLRSYMRSSSFRPHHPRFLEMACKHGRYLSAVSLRSVNGKACGSMEEQPKNYVANILRRACPQGRQKAPKKSCT